MDAADWIEVTLGVTLLPWQREVMERVEVVPRQKSSDDVGPPWCGAGHPSGVNAFCSRSSGHLGQHMIFSGELKGSTWGAELPVCGAAHPQREDTYCTHPPGHDGYHRSKAGLEQGEYAWVQ